MASINPTRPRSIENSSRNISFPRRFRFALALCLATLLGLAPLPLNVRAQQVAGTVDADALLAAKADPLLQTVRRASLADRLAGRNQPVEAGAGERAEVEVSEVGSVSRLAGVSRTPDGSVSLSLTVRLAGQSAEELRRAGFRVGATTGSVATVETEIGRLHELAALPSVMKISAATYSYPTNDLARQAVGVDSPAGTRQVAQTGRGVIVGVIDTGIDFRHADFTVPGTDGRQTRIKALLDMTLYGQQAPDPGWNYVLPGASAPIGHLYTEADINSALQLPATTAQNSDTVKERDKHGHGTYTAAIAAGNGLAGPVPGKYAGMAPETDLVIVKVSRDNTGAGGITNSDIINGMKFVQQTATEMGKPFVINMSLGTNVGSHDGTMDQERAIDEVVGGGPGRAFCVSTGNYGNSDVHASGDLQAGSATVLDVSASAGTSPVFFGLSYARTANLTVTLIRPDGLQIGPVPYTTNQVPTSNQYVDIYNSLDDKRDADPQNDQKAVAIFFKSPAANLGSTPTRTWQVILEAGSVSNGHFDAWIESGRFTSYVDGSRRLSSTATARAAITVGGFVTRPGNREIGDYASYTGTGPTADGREKPDITAPASSIYSAKSSTGTSIVAPLAPDSPSHVSASGTSAAAPVVAGAVALLFEANPNLTSDQIKEVIKSTATRDAFTGGAGWHERFGYGKLNVYAALNALAPAQPLINLADATRSVSEGEGRASLTVTRTNNSQPEVTVNYATSDGAGLSPCSAVNGIASSRCDYATTTGTLRFNAGETSKTIYIPLVDDALAEGAESLVITLSEASGAQLGMNTTATVIINDNDAATGENPVDHTAFFVRQHYIDFLGREPDPAGYQGWQDILNNCGTTVAQPCDRIEVSAAFFRSEEFQSRGYFVYRFYPAALGRVPRYSEFMPDIARVSGFLSAEQLEANRTAFVNEFMNRQEFKTRYDSLTDPAAYVNALLNTAGISLSNRQQLIDDLGAGKRTRGQVLRLIAESVEVYQKFYNEAFVVMQYFGYLRRDPDVLYLEWIRIMNETGGDYRGMISGFVNSAEYRQRFGP
ncbi:MAG TPA: S8 family serine peptidase [Pyrinomonadaceae bacterium]|nr:S8 family serine peptidase [Pyrinomonadaceae bacterium]